MPVEVKRVLLSIDSVCIWGDPRDPNVTMRYSRLRKLCVSKMYRDKRVGVPVPPNKDVIGMQNSECREGDGYLQATEELLDFTQQTLYSVNGKGICGSIKASFRLNRLPHDESAVYFTMSEKQFLKSSVDYTRSDQERLFCLIYLENNTLAMEEVSEKPNDSSSVPTNAHFAFESYGNLEFSSTWKYRFRAFRKASDSNNVSYYIGCHRNGEVRLMEEFNVSSCQQTWPNYGLTSFSINSQPDFQCSESRCASVDVLHGPGCIPQFKRARIAYHRSFSL